MGKICKGSIKLGTGCGSCEKCKKEKRNIIYYDMISDITKMIDGLKSIDHPDFGSISQLESARSSIKKSRDFEFGAGEDFFVGENNCRFTMGQCSSSFFKNAPKCMGCSGYFIRTKR